MSYPIAVLAALEPLVREGRSRYRRDDGHRPRVLLVEDNALGLRSAARLLRTEFEVTAVANGEAALLRFARGDFDVVVTDYQMPAMTGIELLEQIRVRDPHVRRVLMSGGSIPGLDGYIGSGIVEHCLQKPMDLRAELWAFLSGVAKPS